MMLPVKKEWTVNNLAEFLKEFNAHDLFEKKFGYKFDENKFDGYDGNAIYSLLILMGGYYDYWFVEDRDNGGYFGIVEYDLEKLKKGD